MDALKRIPPQHNDTWYKGDTYNRSFVFNNKDVNTSVLTPINLTGVVILWQIREKSKEGALLKEITLGSGATLNVGQTNKIDFNFVQDIKAGTHYTDFQLTFPDGKIITYFTGVITMVQDVSNL